MRPNNRVKRQVHLPLYGGSHNIVAIGNLPPAIREAATGIFLWPASGLDDAIKGDEFEYNNFSHDRVPPPAGDLDAKKDSVALYRIVEWPNRNSTKLSEKFSGRGLRPLFRPFGKVGTMLAAKSAIPAQPF